MSNGKDIRSPKPHGNQKDPFQMTATFLISTNNATNYELVDPRNRSLTNDTEELDWYFQDMFDQLGKLYCLFDDINRLLVDCPLEFLLFEVQQLISFL